MWKVMVVDDERPALEELSECLSAQEQVAEVYRFRKPREALTMFTELSPDLVFLDIEMRGMNGLELAGYIQQLGTSAEIVFVTAYNEHAITAFDLCALDYVLKPLNPQRIKQTLERFARVTKDRGRGEIASSVEAVGADSMVTVATRPIGVHLFGPITVTGKYGDIVWNSSKSRELFVYLLLHPQVGLAQLIDDVFPEFNLDSATHYVHTCLYRIRKSLKECGLGQEITIDYRNKRYETTFAEHVPVDYEHFMGADSAEHRIERYKGELLPEVESEWPHPFRKTCDDLFEFALQLVMDRAQANGNLQLAQKYDAMLSRLRE